MTNLLFVRHGAHDLLSRTLTGRTYPVHLNELGQRQAQWLAGRISGHPIDALLSSPIERCMETAAVISRQIAKKIESVDELIEVDFGTWSGREFSELAPLPEWKAFNQLRSLNSPPGGESLAAIQARLLTLFAKLQSQYPNGCVVLVSHADVIKAALTWLLGVPSDFLNRIEIAPGSLSHAVLDDMAPRVLLLNETLCEKGS